MIDLAFVIGERIKGELNRHPVLYKRFNVSMSDCYDEMLKNYVKILKIINDEYSDDHVFKAREFVMDSVLFSLAYSEYICSNYLGNQQIIMDFVKKKLKSAEKGKFSMKKLNENLSEYIIFFYLVCGVFLKSDLYLNFDKLEYESDGANNKRFEYTFKMKNKKNINVEVKALDCDPFSKDNLDMFQFKDGDILAKAFVPNVKLEEYVTKDKLEAITEISSNYRQLKKNIKKIKEKCESNGDINLGFIIINYGTSIEEFFSYLLNSKNGILNLINTDGISDIVLFSMCTSTTLMFDEVYENEHILSFVMKDNEIENEIFRKLRLDNYVFKDGKVAEGIKYIAEEEFGLYKYIRRNDMVTILRHDVDDDIINEETKKFKNTVEGIKFITDNISE